MVAATKEPQTVFDMCPVWFRLCCALVDNEREDSVQTIRDMNRVSNVGINLQCNDLNIGALASLQVLADLKAWIISCILTFLYRRALTQSRRAGHTSQCLRLSLYLSLFTGHFLQQIQSDG